MTDTRVKVQLDSEQILGLVEEALASVRRDFDERLAVLAREASRSIEDLRIALDKSNGEARADAFAKLAGIEDAYIRATKDWGQWRQDFAAAVQARMDKRAAETGEKLGEMGGALSEMRTGLAEVHARTVATDTNAKREFDRLTGEVSSIGMHQVSLEKHVETTDKAAAELADRLSELHQWRDKAFPELVAGVSALRSAQVERDEKTETGLVRVEEGVEALGDIVGRINDENGATRTRLHELGAKIEAVSNRVEDAKEISDTVLSGLGLSTSKALDANKALRVSLETHVSRIDDALEALGDDTALSRLAEVSATKADLEDLREKLLASVVDTDLKFADANEDFAQRLEKVDDALAEATAGAERRMNEIAATLAHSIATVRDWIPNGPEYWANSVVRHKSGIWIASRETDSVPGEDGSWNLLFEGLQSIRLEQNKRDAAKLELLVQSSSGRVESYPFDLPTFNPRGAWKADVAYRLRDVVVQDGHSWVALCDNPRGAPVESDDWRMLAMRGARGRKGERGPPGETPSMEKFLDAWSNYLDRGDGTPVIRFRGAWNMDKTFDRGDVVEFDKSLFIALRPVAASTETPAFPDRDDWTVFMRQPKYTAPPINIEKDPNPRLGGDVKTMGHQIEITTDGEASVGGIGNIVTPDGDQMYMASLNDEGFYVPDRGAVVLKASGTEVHGATVQMMVMKGGTTPLRDVQITDDGFLVAVDLPEPGWQEVGTDQGDYDLGTFAQGWGWIEMTGLVVTIPEAVAAGERIDVIMNVDATNKTGTRTGTIEVGFGINGAQPASGTPHAIAAGFDGYLITSLTTTTHGGLSQNDTITAWARVIDGSHNSFGVDLLGGVGDEHEMIVTKP